MQLIPVRTSRVLQQKKLAKLKERLVARLDANIARLSGEEAAKLPKAERLYRMTDVLGEVELPTLLPSASLIFSVLPGQGESIEKAVIAAMTELRCSLVADKLDAELLDGPAR